MKKRLLIGLCIFCSFGFSLSNAYAEPTRQYHYPDPVLLENVQAVSTGVNHSCALTNTGGVKCWGVNSSSQLGYEGASSYYPVDVTTLNDGVSVLVSGYYHNCVLTDLGGVKCWGDNFYGQLGDGTRVERSAPVDVVGLTSGVIALSAGWKHTCAVTTDGAAKCWGDNNEFQLGVLDDFALTPIQVSTLTSGTASVMAGHDFSCAIMESGAVKCWGSIAFYTYNPSDVSGLASGVTTLASGKEHVCALLDTGIVKCWGGNDYGQLGDGTIDPFFTPKAVSALAEQTAYLAAGFNHTCAVSVTGNVYCWGDNADKQLGMDTSGIYQTLPRLVYGVLGTPAGIASKFNHNCVVTLAGRVQCWGSSSLSQLGTDWGGMAIVPMKVSGIAAPVLSIDTGEDHSCAIDANGGVMCWGENDWGEIGNGLTGSQNSPVAVIGLSSGVDKVVIGDHHTCALTSTGGVKCWGVNDWGQLGTGDYSNRIQPADVTGLTSGVIDIAAGTFHSCALLATNAIKCWGSNLLSQLGNENYSKSNVPIDVLNLNGTAIQISAGQDRTCSIMSDGTIKCWGDNLYGALGVGTYPPYSSDEPLVVQNVLSGASLVDLRAYHACAVVNGVVKCWGHNLYGKLGDGTTDDRHAPVDVVGLSGEIIEISTGGQHTCAINDAHELFCWGSNNDAQLGTGDENYYQYLTPLSPLGLPANVTAVSGGEYYTCAIAGGDVYCWGNNWTNQLGIGVGPDRAEPAYVVDFWRLFLPVLSQ